MAIKLTSKANTDGITATWPYGKIRDKSTSPPISGTPVNEQVYGDFHQFFERIMAVAGITHNGNPENGTNGFQYVDALIKVAHPDYSSTGVVFQTIAGNTWANISGLYPVAFKVEGNDTVLCGGATITSLATPGSIPIIQLPVGARPATAIRILAGVVRGSTYTTELISVSTAGNVTVDMGAGTFSPVTVYFDGLKFRKA